MFKIIYKIKRLIYMENFDEKNYKINKLKVEKNFMTHCLYDLQKTIIDLKDTIEFKDIKINELENKIKIYEDILK